MSEQELKRLHETIEKIELSRLRWLLLTGQTDEAYELLMQIQKRKAIEEFLKEQGEKEI
jgi:hypothetical protein